MRVSVLIGLVVLSGSGCEPVPSRAEPSFASASGGHERSEGHVIPVAVGGAPTMPKNKGSSDYAQQARCHAEAASFEQKQIVDNDSPSVNGSCGGVGAPPADLFRGLTRGTAAEKSASALRVLETRGFQARSLVRRAIANVISNPSCAHLRPLTDVLDDCTMDDTTRSSAALALGEIGEHFPCLFPPGAACPTPHDPIPVWSKKSLLKCLTQYPATVARACAEALGHVSAENVGALVTVRDDVSKDTLLRVFAGRALTRLTGSNAVTVDSLEKLVQDAHQVAR